MAQYQDQSEKYNFTGMCPGRPPDRLPAGRCAYAQNLRFYQFGAPQPRPGCSVVNATALDQIYVHTIAQLNDSIPGAAVPVEIVIGAGSKLYRSAGLGGAITSIDSGYSGYQLATVPWRPSASPSPWLYVADADRMRKVDPSGNVRQTGIAPPNSPPTAAVISPLFEIIDDFSSATGWTAGGTASAVAASTRLSTTLDYYFSYQTQLSSLPAWYSFTLTAGAVSNQVQVGDLILVDSGASAETVQVRQVINQSALSTTIAHIAYDSGSVGACTIQPSAVTSDLAPGAILVLAGTEAVIVTEVDNGPAGSGVQTFRTSTASTHSAGDAIAGTLTFVASFSFNHVSGAAAVIDDLTFTVASGTGTVYKNASLNLAEVSGRATQPQDYLNIAIMLNSYVNFTSGMVQLGLTSSSLSSSSQVNYLFVPFSTADLYPQLGGQWGVIRVPVSALQSAGLSSGLGLGNVTQIGVSITGVGPINVALSSWWIGGTYGPLVTSAEEPYEYVYTYQSSLTGAESNGSPILRVPVSPQNDAVVVFASVSADTQVDTINYYRRGGGLSTWNLIASSANTNTHITDTASDAFASTQAVLAQDVFVPFAVLGLPQTGTCNVTGTAVEWVSGATFNTAWAAGTYITIAGTVYELYGSPTSTTALNIVASGGFQTGVAFTVQQPLITGQPLGALWGPYQNVLFACGDPYNPGYLYWTNGNDPDSCGNDTYYEACSPSEPLIGGCLYNGRAFLFSCARMFIITPNGTLASGTANFQVQDVPNGKGALAKSLIAVGKEIYFVSQDGIYASSGGAPRSLTDGDLRPLFPKEGVQGTSITIGPDTIVAPALGTLTDAQRSILSYSNQFLYFDYYGTDAAYHTLVFDLVMGGWSYDSFTSPVAATCHYSPDQEGIPYSLVGSNDGRIYRESGLLDDGADYTCVLSTPSFDRGTARGSAQFGDFGYRTNSTVGGAMTTAPYFDEYTVTNSSASPTIPTGYGYQTADILAGLGKIARNFAVRHSWASSTGNQALDLTYSFIPQPDLTYARGEYISNAGTNALKYWQGLKLEVNTFGATKTFTVYVDGASVATFTANTNTQTFVPVSFATPVNGYEVELVGDTSNICLLFSVQWVYDVLPDPAKYWISEPYGFNIPSYKFLRWGRIRLQSTADVTLTVITDGTPQPNPLTVQSTNGAVLVRYVEFQAIKAQLFQFQLESSAAFSAYMSDLQIMGKGVNGDQLVPLRPWGGQSNVTGARI